MVRGCCLWGRRRPRRGMAVGALLLLLLARRAAADVYDETPGPRSLAMGGAHRALGSGNETLWLNPAGMALTKRYSIDVLYGYGVGDHLNHLHASAVDSKSSPVAGGAGYTRDWGNPSHSDAQLNRIYVGSAYAFGEVLAVGVSGTNLRGSYRPQGEAQDVDSYNGTLGLSLALGELVALGASWRNMFPVKAHDLMPPSFGAGLALRSSVLSVAGEWAMDLRHDEPHRHRFGAGAELFAFDALALRAGMRRAPGPPAQRGVPTSYVSGGAGVVAGGGSLTVAAERSLGSSGRWTMLGSLSFYL